MGTEQIDCVRKHCSQREIKHMISKPIKTPPNKPPKSKRLYVCRCNKYCKAHLSSPPPHQVSKYKEMHQNVSAFCNENVEVSEIPASQLKRKHLHCQPITSCFQFYAAKSNPLQIHKFDLNKHHSMKNFFRSRMSRDFSLKYKIKCEIKGFHWSSLKNCLPLAHHSLSL